MSSESASVRLSTEHKGHKRREPVWLGRYRIAVGATGSRATGKDSVKVLGKAWTKRSRPPAGYLTRAAAEDALRRFLGDEGARLVAAGGIPPSDGRPMPTSPLLKPEPEAAARLGALVGEQLAKVTELRHVSWLANWPAKAPDS